MIGLLSGNLICRQCWCCKGKLIFCPSLPSYPPSPNFAAGVRVRVSASKAFNIMDLHVDDKQCRFLVRVSRSRRTPKGTWSCLPCGLPFCGLRIHVVGNFHVHLHFLLTRLSWQCPTRFLGDRPCTKPWKPSRRTAPNKLKRSMRSGRPKARWTDPHPSLSAACVGETVISATGYQDIADNAPGTSLPEGDQPVCNHSLPRLTDLPILNYPWVERETHRTDPSSTWPCCSLPPLVIRASNKQKIMGLALSRDSFLYCPMHVKTKNKQTNKQENKKKSCW